MYITSKHCKYFLVIALTILTFACTNKAKESNAQVHSAAQKIHADNKADEALLLLKTVETGLLSEAEYAYYTLIQIIAWDFAGVNITMSDTSIIKSRDYFIKANNSEKEKGNNTVANEFKRQYNQLKEDKANTNKMQLEEVKQENAQREAEQTRDKLLALEASWAKTQEEINKNSILMYIAFACLALIIIFILRERKQRIGGYEQYSRLEFEKETQARNLLQHNDLIRLHAWVDENSNPSDFNKRLLAKIEQVIPNAHWELNPKLYAINYHTMLYNFQLNFPYLDELEHGFICLICTGLHNEKEMIEALEVSPQHYQHIEKSVRHKLSEKGHVLENVISESRAEYKIEPINNSKYLSPKRYIIWRRKVIRTINKIRSPQID